jgi:6-phosphogluconolactonase/glucosamine-6-phosphate isomerase/deaminase
MNSISTENPIAAAAEHLTRVITTHLSAGERVLWLLSGGSGSKVVIETAKQLASSNLENLSVTLTDERFGPIGHADENWQQFLDNGFTLPGAMLYRPLIDKDRQTTTDTFALWLETQITESDYTIGLFGIGSDGHTAGVKPHSSAVDAPTWAADFTGDDFERITMTPRAISQLDEAVIQASGVDKVPTLTALLHSVVDIEEQPAQVLKSVPICTLYTDNKEL